MGGVSEPCFHGWMSIGLASETILPALSFIALATEEMLEGNLKQNPSMVPIGGLDLRFEFREERGIQTYEQRPG